MMGKLKITKEARVNGGRYSAIVDGHEAVITFSERGKSVIVVDHTGVPQAIGGRGVALALTEFMIDDARAAGFKIAPSCSYTAAQFRRRPDWADVLAQ